MRSFLAATLMLILGCGSAAAQSQPVAAEAAEAAPADIEPIRKDLTATVSAGVPVFIDNPHGNVYLRFGGYEHAVDIHSTLQQPAGAPALTLQRGMDGGRYVISTKLAADALAPGQRLDLVVYVAQGHAVSVRTARGAIEARGLKGDLELNSASGNITVRGTEGTLQAQTGEDGSIEVALADTAPAGSKQRLATQTGNITVGVTDRLDARIRMATSALFATEFSLDIAHFDGEEPNKWGQVVIGVPKSELMLESRRGEIRLMRRAVYLEVGERPPQ